MKEDNWPRSMKGSSSDTQHGKPGLDAALIFIAVAVMISFGLTENIDAVEKSLPFCPGEKLTFQVRWTFIPAGEATFYKVRDRVDAYADIEMTHSVLYRKQKKGKRRRDVVVNFDWERQEAQYCNFGKKRRPISILPGSFDPLSVFYAFRLHDRKENPEIKAPVTDGKRCVMGRVKIVKREKIKVASGTYDTYLVEPDLEHIRGVFAKSKDAKLKIWVTADRRRIPVKVKSKVVVGSFVAELISAEGIAPYP
jgi:hypothetical protein